MLSIRTQDRMALVPYIAKISIECNMYKIANKEEIEETKEYNKKLLEKLKYETQYGNRNNLLEGLVSMSKLDEMYKKQKKEVPKEEYNEWNIKHYSESGYAILGTYATKERALEVLDEIEQAVVGKLFIPETYFVKKEYLDYGTSNPCEEINTTKIERLPTVYRMPKE